MSAAEKREPINLSDSFIDVITKMSEGNPGGASVIGRIGREHPDNFAMLMMGLDDMNIRGSQIWVGYKDHCEQDLARFVECIQNRDAGMVDTINNVCYHPEREKPEYMELAVRSGASFENVAGAGAARGMGL